MRAIFFFIVNFIALAILYRLLKPSESKPSPLNINDPHSPGKKPKDDNAFGHVWGGPRSLNCVFQFNGHSWDAFEVLGLPAGADFEMSRKAWEKARSEGLQTEDFLNHAWTALEGYHGRRKP